MNTFDLLMQLKVPAWAILVLAVVAVLGMVLYRHLFDRQIKLLEHRLKDQSTIHEKRVEFLQERHKKRLDAFDEVNAALMDFRHSVEHIQRGDADYCAGFEERFEETRTLARTYQSLLGEQFYRAVLKYTDLGKEMLVSNFTITNKTLESLRREEAPPSLLEYIRDREGRSVPVTSAEDLIYDLDEEARLGHAELIFYNSVDKSLNNQIRDAGRRLYELRETILRTFPSL